MFAKPKLSRLGAGVVAGALAVGAASGATSPAFAAGAPHGSVSFKGYWSGTATVPGPSAEGRGCYAQVLRNQGNVHNIALGLGNVTLSVSGKREALGDVVLSFNTVRYGNTEKVTFEGGARVATFSLQYRLAGSMEVRAYGKSGSVTTSSNGSSGSAKVDLIVEKDYEPVAADNASLSASWSSCHI